MKCLNCGKNFDYEKYYGIEVTDEELLNIYFPSEESAANW